MTIDVEDRRAALKRALVHLAELCGDEKGIRFGEENLVPAKPLRTTLSELREAGLAEQIVQLGSSKEPYLLTLDGWFTAQKVSGRFGSAEFDARRGRVCAAMKAVTAGRHERVLLDWRKLAAAAEVPAGWLWNVFDAQVIYRLDAKSRYWLRFERGTVWVETTFGQEPVDLG